MSKNGIRYSEELKQQIVDFYQAGSSVTYLSREYGVTNVTLDKWIKELSNAKVSDTETMSVKEYEKIKKRICKVLKFPRSTYYKTFLRVPSNRKKKASTLKSEIYEIWKKSKRRYGAPKI